MQSHLHNQPNIGIVFGSDLGNLADFIAATVEMITVSKAITANHCYLKAPAIRLVTNIAAEIEKKKLSGDEAIKTTNQYVQILQTLISGIIAER